MTFAKFLRHSKHREVYYMCEERDEDRGISAFKQLENTEHDGEKLPGERLEKTSQAKESLGVGVRRALGNLLVSY